MRVRGGSSHQEPPSTLSGPSSAPHETNPQNPQLTNEKNQRDMVVEKERETHCVAMSYSTPDLALFVHSNDSRSRALQTCQPLSFVYSRLLPPTATSYSTPDLALFVHFNNSWSHALQMCRLLGFVYSGLLLPTAMLHNLSSKFVSALHNLYHGLDPTHHEKGHRRHCHLLPAIKVFFCQCYSPNHSCCSSCYSTHYSSSSSSTSSFSCCSSSHS